MLQYNNENCGSCEAAEQFVDIKLGAKYLLTLTSFYYDNSRAEYNSFCPAAVGFLLLFITIP